MILSRARDALQTPADTRFQWKGQGRGLKNTHISHFAFPRLPEVVKIKGMHGTPDRTAWTPPSHGEKKRKVLLPEQAWRPQTITAELDSSLPRHWTRLERPWTTVGQPKPCETSTRAVVRRALEAESGKKGRVRGSEADLAQCGALALPPPFLFLWLLVQIYFNAPLLHRPRPWSSKCTLIKFRSSWCDWSCMISAPARTCAVLRFLRLRIWFRGDIDRLTSRVSRSTSRLRSELWAPVFRIFHRFSSFFGQRWDRTDSRRAGKKSDSVR